MNQFDPNIPQQAHENIAATLLRVLPEAKVVPVPALEVLGLTHVAVPKGQDLKQIDSESFLMHPRRTKAVAKLADADSFCAYVNKHQKPATVVWCNFNPQTYQLSFTAVVDEHAPDVPGWRAHQAVYAPDMSAEWKTWKGKDSETMQQLEFALFLERNELDVASGEGLPTSADMLKMATQFQANSEKRVKSIARLQSGGVQLEYVDDEDEGTREQMKLFERFAIGIPVFWAGPAYRIGARLRYRKNQEKVSFWYELIRPDHSHEAAAKDLIEKVRQGIGSVPLLMGECK